MLGHVQTGTTSSEDVKLRLLDWWPDRCGGLSVEQNLAMTGDAVLLPSCSVNETRQSSDWPPRDKTVTRLTTTRQDSRQTHYRRWTNTPNDNQLRRELPVIGTHAALRVCSWAPAGQVIAEQTRQTIVSFDDNYRLLPFPAQCAEQGVRVSVPSFARRCCWFAAECPPARR